MRRRERVPGLALTFEVLRQTAKGRDRVPRNHPMKQTTTGPGRSLVINSRCRGGSPGGRGRAEPQADTISDSSDTPRGYRTWCRFWCRLPITKQPSPSQTGKQGTPRKRRKKKGNPWISKGCLVWWRRRVGIEPTSPPSFSFTRSAGIVALSAKCQQLSNGVTRSQCQVTAVIERGSVTT